MRGTILVRARVKNGKIGGVIHSDGRMIWCYMGAVIYAPTQTMAMNLAGLDWFIEAGGNAVWHQVEGEELWFEADVETILGKGFIATFSRTKQEPRMNLYLKDWRRMPQPEFSPYIRYADAEEIVVLEDISEDEFWRRRGKPTAPRQLEMF